MVKIVKVYSPEVVKDIMKEKTIDLALSTTLLERKLNRKETFEIMQEVVDAIGKGILNLVCPNHNFFIFQIIYAYNQHCDNN